MIGTPLLENLCGVCLDCSYFLTIGSNVDATAITVEVDVTVCEGEEGVILAHSDVLTRMPLCATLTDDDVTSDD